MNTGFRALALVAAVLVMPVAAAQEQKSVNERDCDYSYMLVNEDGSKTRAEQYAKKDQHEAECRRDNADHKQRAANARVRLTGEFKVDSGGMSDKEAIARLNEEIGKKAEADKNARELRAQQAEQQRMNQASAMLDKQDQMLKGLGVNLRTSRAEDEEGPSDAEYDATELQMYQTMVDQGAAPQCKGKKGAQLVVCVDAALGEEE